MAKIYDKYLELKKNDDESIHSTEYKNGMVYKGIYICLNVKIFHYYGFECNYLHELFNLNHISF